MSKFAKEIDEATPNLIPIMNLFTALIPFLLMSAVFFRLSIIQISIPVNAEGGETDIAKEEDKITLNLQVFPDRYEMSASSDTLTPDILKRMVATVPRSKADDQEPVLQQLSQEAHRIKGKYTSSDTVIIVPEDDIGFQDVIWAIDAVRNIKLEREGEQVTVTLFPKVVLSSRVK